MIVGGSLVERLGFQIGDRITLVGDIFPVTMKFQIRGIYTGPDDLARGISPIGIRLREDARIVAGRWLEPGKYEMVVGRGRARFEAQTYRVDSLERAPAARAGAVGERGAKGYVVSLADLNDPAGRTRHQPRRLQQTDAGSAGGRHDRCHDPTAAHHAHTIRRLDKADLLPKEEPAAV